MDIIFYTETTTDGKTYSYCSDGKSTGDIKIVEISKNGLPNLKTDDFKEDILEELTREEEVKFYKRALETTIL